MKKKKMYVYMMLLAMSLSILSVNLGSGTAFALTGANGNVIDNDHAPRSAILVATGTSISSYKAGWLPPVNTTGLVEYMQFYSQLDKAGVITLLQDKTKTELESYDKAKNSSGPNAAYIVTNVSYADGKGNTFPSNQIEIQGAMAPSDQRAQYAYNADNASKYNFYVASISVDGIIGVTQINEYAATNAAITKNGSSTINDYTVSFKAPADTNGISGYLVLYTTSTKENTLNALRVQSKAQLEALDTASNRAKLIPAASVNPSSGEIAFKAGQLPYNTGTFSTLTNYNVFVVAINNVTTAGVGVVGIAQAGVISKVDLTQAQSELIAPSEGELTDFYVLFNKKMNGATTAITNVSDLLQSLEVVNGTDVTPVSLLGASSNSVRWLRPDIAKISVPAVNLRIGDQLQLTYASAVKDTFDVAPVSPALSPAALKDDAKPVGRVIQPTEQSGLTRIVIRFNEKMSGETTAITDAKDFARRIDLITGEGKAKSTIDLTAATVAWTGNTATVTIPPTAIEQGDLFRIQYTDKVKDFFGNPASNEGTSAPIGGGFTLSTVDVHASVLNEIRKSSGGRTPKIAVLTSGSAGENAADTYYKDTDDTATGISYEKEFIRYGFDPVYIPVNNVNYQAQRNNPEVVALANEATAVYFNGGDQFRHAKSLFNDDGMDSRVLSSLKQIFYSGGTATGSSAGDHILSSPMHGGGDSYTDMNNNGMVVNSLSDATIGQGSRSGVMPGFGFISPYGTTDSHFDQRGRIGRLIVAMRETNQLLGFGVDENTSFIVSEGKGKVLGANGVFVVDASHALFSDPGTEGGKEFAATGIIVNYLTNGDQYDFAAHAVISSKPLIDTPAKTVYNSANIFNSLENTKVITTLADSAATMATGISSQFKLIYSKDANTKGYKSGTKYTVSGMNLAINKYVRSITLDGLNLNPAYSLNTTSYNVEVEPAQTSVSIKTVVDDATTALTLNGEDVASGATRSVALTPDADTTAVLVATPAVGIAKTYTILIHARPKRVDATLSEITIGGRSLSDFSSANTSYTVELPVGTTSVPTVTGTATDVKATVEVTAAEGLPGTTMIQVTAEDGSKKTYTIIFSVKQADPKSNDATLSGITVAGVSLSGFNSTSTSYTVELPAGTTLVPAVTANATDVKATVEVTAAEGLPGTTTIQVTAEDGSKKTYTIIFSVKQAEDPKSNDATLSGITVAGVSLSGFNSTSKSYTVELPAGTTVVPAVTANANDVKATVEVTAAEGLPGTTTIQVTAEDGSKKTYEIHFNVKKSNDATLSEIQIGGTSLSGFSSTSTTYTVELPVGTTSVPTVTGTATDVKATVEVTAAEGLPGTTMIQVTAEDGSKKTYTIIFSVKQADPKSNDATLSGITVAGVSLSGFNSTSKSYTVELPAGTTVVPAVTANATDVKATVEVTAAEGLPGTTTIQVTAEDGSKKTYTIIFTVQASNPYVYVPVTTVEEKPVTDGNMYKVTSDMLKKAENGQTVIEVAATVSELKLPVDAAELLGQNKLEVKSGPLSLVIPTSILKQLESQLSAEERKNGTISLKFKPLQQAEKNALIEKAQASSKAQIKLPGEVYEFSLAAVDAKGAVSQLSAFDEPITLTLKAGLSPTNGFTGLYYLADDGTLEYIDSTYSHGELVAKIRHFSKYAVLEVNKTFKDVADTHWAAAVIKEMAAKQILNGTAPDTFEPNRAITRAEFTALLVQALKLTEKAPLTFTDVQSTDWYANVIAIAVKAGLVNGKSETRFDPDALITREEMAAMAVKAYTLLHGQPAAPAAHAASGFQDEALVSKWAQAYVLTAETLQLVHGRQQGLFVPRGHSSRAEAAQVIYNLLRN